MLVERRPLHDLSLDGIVQRRQQVHDERLQYNLRGDAVDEKLVQLLPRRDEAVGTLLVHDPPRELRDVPLPVRVWDRYGRPELSGGIAAGGDMAGFQHEEGPAEVAIRRARDVDGQFVGERYVLLAGDGLQDRAYLGGKGRDGDILCAK